ncbi:hypothetical protein RMCBS344292_04550 [Rhizopus microsporus]|nr:hypothetical protein RMCBS344292_04550 [Rhizopus microsporus]
MSPSSPASEIEQNVSKLLQATKKLLESLTAWSFGELSDNQVHQDYQALDAHFSHISRTFELLLLPME